MISNNVPLYLSDNQIITCMELLKLIPKYSKNSNEIRAANDLVEEIERKYNETYFAFEEDMSFGENFVYSVDPAQLDRMPYSEVDFED